MSREIEEALGAINIEVEEADSEVETATPEEEQEEEEQAVETVTSEDDEASEEVAETGEDDTPAYKDIKAKYPEFFKDFPGMRKAFFREGEYAKVFPTVEEAKEAAEELEELREFHGMVTDGSQENLTTVLKTMNEEEKLTIAENFLPALLKTDQDAYYKVMAPQLARVVRNMYDAGIRAGNENLKNASLLASQHLFGDQKIASGETKVADTPTTDPKIQEERNSFRQERYTSLYNDVIQDSDSQLRASVLDGLDPQNKMTDRMKNLLSNNIMSEINNVLHSDAIHKSRMTSLWKKAEREGFTSAWKGKIVSAYIARAKEVMPEIRSKVKSDVLGTKTKVQAGAKKERKETATNSGSGGTRQVQDLKNLDSSKVDWSKTSELDFLKGRVSLK